VTDPDGPLAIGIDVGGTKLAGGVVDQRGRVRALTRAATPADDPTRLRDVVVDLVRELALVHPVVAVGLGAAGWVDTTGTVSFAPHLAWRGEPLRDRVATALAGLADQPGLADLPVRVENDATAAAWAEHQFGAGRPGPGPLVLVTVGTGIGGGIVVGGRLLRGAHGYAGEPGHQVVVPDGHPCSCGRRGCLEQYASGQALVRFVQTGAAEHPSRADRLRELVGDPAGLTGRLVTTAARSGDKLARAAFDQVGHWLGVGLADLVQLLDPEVLVIGGGVAEAGELLLAPTRQSYRQALARRGGLPAAELRPARLGNLAGLVGAADLARAAAGSAGRARTELMED
jgi:glucokinase